MHTYEIFTKMSEKSTTDFSPIRASSIRVHAITLRSYFSKREDWVLVEGKCAYFSYHLTISSSTVLSRDRIFRGPDGKEYIWKLTTRSCKVIIKFRYPCCSSIIGVLPFYFILLAFLERLIKTGNCKVSWETIWFALGKQPAISWYFLFRETYGGIDHHDLYICGKGARGQGKELEIRKSALALASSDKKV